MQKFLVVEDDANLATAIKIRLCSLGYTPIVAGTVSDAASILAYRKPELSIVDLNLPDGSGFAIAKQIRNNPKIPRIPVIFLSGSSDLSDRELARTYTNAPFLEKPLHVQTLIDALAVTHATYSQS